MKSLLYKVIFMMTIFGVVDAMASNQASVEITNNSLDGVSLELHDAQGNFIATGSGPMFLQPGQSSPIQSSYAVQRNIACNHSTDSQEQCRDKQMNAPVNTMIVNSIKITFQHSGLSFTIPMPTSPINIIPNNQLVTLVNNSTDLLQASFYDKDNTLLNPGGCSLVSADSIKQAGAPINVVYIPKNVATITIDLGSGLTFSMPAPTEEISNIFSNDQHDQLVKVTNNSEDFVNATLPDGNIIQFISPGQSHYIPITVSHMSIAKSLGDGTWGPTQNIVMQEKDFNLFA